MLLKGILVCLLIFIVFNLFRALPILIKGNSDVPMSRYLGRRVLFSVIAFVILLIAMATGLIEPNNRPY
ncbi:hypothetical protein BCT30_08485 [Enterovibrio norvegicus]|uniref:DUF2909 domain-containing protein n=1 Tax=Enterovibrio norvegicus TaxID=188144 RepID=UPI000C838012|nr:DUF2909 domain-containing protein [Enterovibrio norvegicus]PMI32669.1 hypothetical protein BCU47_12115 [Enterovibrio norvegicus]PMI38248.1 hypothetical protein BCU46_08715 [Enterovibrio norvegicus]PMN55403.1 hypothetical protein BCT30_08485 [Enterovibrio norvegicus]TKF08958.1 DUF2909 domain-containing protein [Enterovibrio norvegicus]TKF36347.1 DUF2909 domain-containing protein [Enterovibrio norvegicus]